MMVNGYYMEDKEKGNVSTFYLNRLTNNYLDIKQTLSEVRLAVYQNDIFLKSLEDESC